ncbi:Na/Pi cotransporter family protein [Flexibacterium corallicola]|uniref:Na/Pi cotransporter family protein n=1 Tax=Flexibacterium corallicola TaxID=3037259 RepID=UPI00286F5F03|nr:Na/Pi cotransporter family protein [Pseudovibrio sp. M1P-2-3]
MNAFEVILHMCAGIALLFWATRMIRTGVERAFGNRLAGLLNASTSNRFAGFGTGLVVSTTLQSSTATAILTGGFVSRGLITLAGSLAIMLGADLGSTLVVQIISMDISWLLPTCLIIGGGLFWRGTSRSHKQAGRIILGVGQMLLALSLISAASAPLRQSEALPVLLNLLSGDPVVAILSVAALTWVLHSSVAVILITITLASSGVIPLHHAVLFVLGANIGSAIIPLVLTMKETQDVRRMALGNLLFKVAGVVVMLVLLNQKIIPPSLWGAEPARALANFHSTLNLALSLIGLPLCGPMAALCQRLLSKPEEDTPLDAEKRHSLLDPTLQENPSQAFPTAMRELLHMSEKVDTMLRGVLTAFENGDKSQIRQLMGIDDEVDELHKLIKEYLTNAASETMSEEEFQQYSDLMNYCVRLEHAGSIIQRNLLKLAEKKHKIDTDFSSEGWREISTIHRMTLENLQLSLNVLVSRDLEAARQLITRKDELRQMEVESRRNHLLRLSQGKTPSLNTSSIHLETIRDLKNINALFTSIAYPLVSEQGGLLDSRLAQVPSPHPDGPSAKEIPTTIESAHDLKKKDKSGNKKKHYALQNA